MPELNDLKLSVLRLSKLIKKASKQTKEESLELLERLGSLPKYQTLSFDERYDHLEEVTLSDCKELVALEYGVSNFEALVCQEDWLVYDEKLSNAGLNIWFANYLEAKAYQQKQKKSFLFPYKNTFFVCLETHLQTLGMDANDPDWDKIQRDWARPLDVEAKSRLREKLAEVRQKNT